MYKWWWENSIVTNPHILSKSIWSMTEPGADVSVMLPSSGAWSKLTLRIFVAQWYQECCILNSALLTQCTFSRRLQEQVAIIAVLLLMNRVTLLVTALDWCAPPPRLPPFSRESWIRPWQVTHLGLTLYSMQLFIPFTVVPFSSTVPVPVPRSVTSSSALLFFTTC